MTWEGKMFLKSSRYTVPDWVTKSDCTDFPDIPPKEYSLDKECCVFQRVNCTEDTSRHIAVNSCPDALAGRVLVGVLGRDKHPGKYLHSYI